MMKTFTFHYRHSTGHRHILTIVVDVSVGSTSSYEERTRKVAEVAITNIFQEDYLEGLELVEVKEKQDG